MDANQMNFVRFFNGRFFAKKPKPLEERFTGVFKDALWGDEETRSGPGSKRASGHVQATLEYLELVVSKYKIRSISDIPCGDFNWQPLFFDAHPEIKYSGYDIVGPLIMENKLKNPKYHFDQIDITEQSIPKSDLILCKDMLNHLTYVDIKRAVANMKKSGAKFLLASNDFNCEKNEDVINVGNNHRPVDLLKPPLNFPPPIWNTHYMGLWELSKMLL